MSNTLNDVLLHRCCFGRFSIVLVVGILLGYGTWAGASASDGIQHQGDIPVPCTTTWFQWVEENITTGDGRGHGPDPGSAEWMSAVEFKLGVRGQPSMPPSGGDDWCRFIDTAASKHLDGTLPSAGPSFSCEDLEDSSIESLICSTPALTVLDRQMAVVYDQARQKAANEHPPILKAEQRGWIKGRNECWKADDHSSCTEESYIRRIAELQARYQLVEAGGTTHYVCNNNPANEFIATYFPTRPATALVERGDQVSLMYRQESASGGKYVGRNESLWEHQGEARITWGFDAPTLQCTAVR